MNRNAMVIVKIAGCVLLACVLCLAFMKACSPSGVEPPGSTSVVDVLADAEAGDTPEEYDCCDDIEPAHFLSTEGGKFANDRTLTLAYNDKGDTLSVGMDTGDRGDFLYLNLSSSASSLSSPIGFYVIADSGYLSYSQEEYVGRTVAIGSSDNGNLLLGRTYDQAVPAIFRSEDDYGVRWTTDAQGDATLHIRGIDLADTREGKLLFTCTVTISYDKATGEHRLGELSLSEVAHTGELQQDEREWLVMDAIDFMRNSDRNYRAQDTSSMRDEDAYWSLAARSATVERVPMTYFTKLYDCDGHAINRRDFLRCEVYAVSFPLTAYGFVTLYYAPALQLVGMESPYAPGESSLNLTMFGYDAFYPFTQETLDAAAFNAPW